MLTLSGENCGKVILSEKKLLKAGHHWLVTRIVLGAVWFTLKRFSQTNVILSKSRPKHNQHEASKAKWSFLPLKSPKFKLNIFKELAYSMTTDHDVNATVLKTSSQTWYWKYSAVGCFKWLAQDQLHTCHREIPLCFAKTCYPFWLSNMCGRGFIFQQDIDAEHAWKLLYTRPVWCPRKSRHCWLVLLFLHSH